MNPRVFPDNYVQKVKQFFDSEPHRLNDQICDDLFDRPTLFPLQRKQEMRLMLNHVAYREPKTVMELGIDKGGGVYQWLRACPTIKNFIGSEVRGIPASELFEQHFPEINFLWLEDCSRSQESIKAVHDFGHKIDVLFLDGDKDNFIEDFDTYLPFMNIPGWVFFHDILLDGPGSDYREICSRGYQHYEIVDISELVPTDNSPEQWDSSYQDWLDWHDSNQVKSCGVGVIKIHKWKGF